MKEQSRTTELVEKETTETITVCNGCGEEVENGKEFYTVGSSILLHFCNSCLPDENGETLTGKLAYRAPTVPPNEENNIVYMILAISGAVYAFLSGLIGSGSVAFSLVGYSFTLLLGLGVAALLIAGFNA